MECRDPSHPLCPSATGCVSAESWNWKRGWDSDPGTRMWAVGSPSSVLATMLCTQPSLCPTSHSGSFPPELLLSVHRSHGPLFLPMMSVFLLAAVWCIRGLPTTKFTPVTRLSCGGPQVVCGLSGKLKGRVSLWPSAWGFSHQNTWQACGDLQLGRKRRPGKKAATCLSHRNSGAERGTPS